MTNFLRKYVAAAACLAAPFLAHAQSIPLDNVPALGKALMRGQAVRTSFDLSKCKNDSPGEPSPAVSGGLVIDPFNILPNGTIAFSNTHFTLGPGNQPVNEIIRFRVNTDRSVQLTITTLSIPTYQPLRNIALTCEVGNSVNFFVQLF
ncbi:VirK family protein [Variovorax sp. ZS18.2.2]|uniref:VirK family protein n=1 Tax=Variovorax sp. ZS18.2.2 TaxID=2971255 RepID=UPI002150C2AB|nr:VirK family protein [Variovorax sp. ZS18.2.2]MCR6476777.1 VirK family protein [Variovorax sp. ZS18.2.2]